MSSVKTALERKMTARQGQLEITLNGSVHELATSISVAALVESLGLNAAKVAVERNLEIVPRSVYDRTMIECGDRLEIVQFIGGG